MTGSHFNRTSAIGFWPLAVGQLPKAKHKHFVSMHYRTLSMVISIVIFSILYITAEYPESWAFFLGLIGVPVLIVYLTIRILRAPNVDQEPPPKYKWYDH